MEKMILDNHQLQKILEPLGIRLLCRVDDEDEFYWCLKTVGGMMVALALPSYRFCHAKWRLPTCLLDDA